MRLATFTSSKQVRVRVSAQPVLLRRRGPGGDLRRQLRDLQNFAENNAFPVRAQKFKFIIGANEDSAQAHCENF